ncbi:radical SAM protein [Desulforhabdus amnigena]|jgi:putative pyruvate formate lyase activating enzyme|uniref:Radical SAM protein n=1 Tax=Desulforhabdus amnigena TaxID=40218 RepID=A0A9W6D2X7_9BACT|nr:radical SAM protein [Desulforhabdus amnigena]NLJ29757.1 radical SAM protein [Deltaproteobacteria bacterium]GLI33220.1 radical SAM protein [Desulforhabdus amnigena]
MSDRKIERPAYIELFESGVLAERSRILDDAMACCNICPRQCGVNRKAGKTGFCGVGPEARIAAMSIHPWEEPPISGTNGSGTIFFSGCTLKCLFCQNFPISQMGVGRSMSPEDLAVGMMKLQKKGAHNINLVTPTHQTPVFLKALLLAIPMGLHIPIVYNCSGYERVETLRLLEGVVDIYLPDIKYADSKVAQTLSGAADYVEFNRTALREMWRQVGLLQMDEKGLARKGMMVRHLVLPEDLSGTFENLSFLMHAMGPEVWVSLMCQYFPAHKAFQVSPLDRKITLEEYEKAFDHLMELGMLNGFVQRHSEEEEVFC